MNQWRGIKIYISFIQHPEMGPGSPDTQRFPTAIEICRTAAAMPEHNSVLWQLIPLGLAGAAFGGENRYPLETRWVLEKLAQSGVTEFPTLKYVYDRLWDVWSSEGSYLEGVRMLGRIDDPI
jgi:hypothetical protein